MQRELFIHEILKTALLWMIWTIRCKQVCWKISSKVHLFLKQYLRNLHFMKTRFFTKPFQASPSWHQLKALLFIKWRTLFQKTMDFDALTKQEGIKNLNWHYWQCVLSAMLCLEVSPLKALLKRIRCKFKKNTIILSASQQPLGSSCFVRALEFFLKIVNFHCEVPSFYLCLLIGLPFKTGLTFKIF